MVGAWKAKVYDMHHVQVSYGCSVSGALWTPMNTIDLRGFWCFAFGTSFLSKAMDIVDM